jgi:hypothetical protein
MLREEIERLASGEGKTLKRTEKMENLIHWNEDKQSIMSNDETIQYQEESSRDSLLCRTTVIHGLGCRRIKNSNKRAL